MMKIVNDYTHYPMLSSSRAPSKFIGLREIGLVTNKDRVECQWISDVQRVGLELIRAHVKFCFKEMH